MTYQASDLPKASSLSSADLQRTINNLRSILLAPKRRPCDMKFTRREWAREKAQMRCWLGIYSELLELRTREEKRKARRKVQPLPEPISGFDSDLLTPAEQDSLREIKVRSEAAFPAGNGCLTGVSPLVLLTTICEERRSR